MSDDAAGASAQSDPWSGVLDDWFLDDDGVRRDRPLMKRWFRSDEAFDRRLAARWRDTIEAAASGRHDGWLARADGALAWLVLLDQFPRNVWRGQARAFAFGEHALAGCRLALARGFDEALPPTQRLFMYLPLEHDESMASQRVALEKLERLCRDADGDTAEFAQSALESAEEHAMIIARFGRYPYRNEVLGRTSTPAERAWLDAGSRGFGQ